jgi:CMP/dCMP kinase
LTVVAIDGPAGAGKSTVAGAVAQRLGFEYLDTGAMYRALAWAALEAGLDLSDEEGLTALAETVEIEIEGDAVRLNGRDVTEVIRGEAVTRAVSRVAAATGVRSSLAKLQRARARAADVVMEGRDIGSVVVPDAEVKIFLSASLQERARRRTLQQGLSTDEHSLARVAEELAARDRADSERDASPLIKAPDAVDVNSDGKDVASVVEEIVRVTKRVLDGR